MSDKKAKILEKVRALLAKADGGTTPEEAEALRAKADELMVAYAIEQWQVDAAQGLVGARPMPVKREFDFSWWTTSERYEELWSMFMSVSRHCRCVVALRGYRGGKMPVIGLESDLDYFDMLFTHLMLQMGKQLEPVIDPEAGLDKNAYELRAAGMHRSRAVKKLYEAGLLGDNDTPYHMLTKSREKSMRGRIRVAGERYAEKHGLDSTTTVTPKVYQRSFAIGFVREVASRLADMRRMQEPRQTGSQELALRDIRQAAVDLYNELFPVPEDTGVSSKGGSRSLVRERKLDYGSMSKGVAAGKRADITGKGGHGLRQRKQIGD